jgi:hypothetical protein
LRAGGLPLHGWLSARLQTSIAELLGNYVDQDVRPEEISVIENPSETGSFYVGWRFNRYVLSPAGEIASDVATRSAAQIPLIAAARTRERML